MKLKRTYKYRIYPNREEKSILDKTLNTCRILYNDCLTERRDAWQSCRKHINYYDQANQLKEIKTFDEDLKEVHSQVIQDVLKRIDKAFKNFFRRVKRREKAGYPRYKPRSRYNSFTFPQNGFKLENRKLILSKIGSVNIKKYRDIPKDANIKTCAIEKDLDRWYACFSVEVEVEIEEPNYNEEITSQNPIGIDLGISHLITLSNGETKDNPKDLSKSEGKLKRKQRKLNKARKRSNNRGKRRFEIAKTHRKVRVRESIYFIS